MLTERLGDLGFPFDDKQRTVSTLGNELRIVRNQSAHTHDFTVAEAFRANDYCVRLLEHFGDEAGLEEARRIRREALLALAAEEGLTEDAAAASATDRDTELEVPREQAAVEAPSDDELVEPDPEVLERGPSVIGAQGLPYEPWQVVPVGTVEDLDNLPKKAAKEKVRAVATEIVTYEGPIHLDRLVEKTAQSFGLQRVRASRARRIRYQIQREFFVDPDKFVWPHEIDPGTWTEFRPNDSNAERTFTDISPVEIANAAKFIKARHPDIGDEDLEVAVLRTFGRKRRSRQIADHLAKARGRWL